MVVLALVAWKRTLQYIEINLYSWGSPHESQRHLASCCFAGLSGTCPGAAAREEGQVGEKPGVWLEVAGPVRRVLIDAEVVKREGELEEFLCRSKTKEHESILKADIDARDAHKALLLAGVESGAPVRFDPVYKAASGGRVRVFVRVTGDDGKVTEVSARSWIKQRKTGKELDSDWVFAGSKILDDQNTPGRKLYLANDGDVICLSNFDTAMLDLPVASSKDNGNLDFEAWTERIPKLGTKVTVVLEAAKK